MDSGVFSYVKVHLHVQRNKLLSETKASNVEKKEFHHQSRNTCGSVKHCLDI